ncbi:hypothetical protein JOB18_041914 [Solea senegalensis]|uniref:Uncharacterized protein n=1 Tax=Solea senegalensis TaxID=28829 RepID=A0AAV6S6T7_SOLSE|nr:hypothetical protein JOB18_041914 [Solea senegalensis]
MTGDDTAPKGGERETERERKSFSVAADLTPTSTSKPVRWMSYTSTAYTPVSLSHSLCTSSVCR